MGEPVAEVERNLASKVEALGFDLVQIEWAGSTRRPILRIRIDLADGSDPAGRGPAVTVDDCAEVSRGLEPWLDSVEGLSERYVLEVSSPGVNRPLTRDRDWERYVGESIAVKGPRVLAGRATYLEGELLGLVSDEDGGTRVRLQLGGGEVLEIPRDEISGAHVLFRWS